MNKPITHACDRCGQPLPAGALRFVARIQVYAAPDAVPIEPQDLEGDPGKEWERLLRQCEGLSEQDLMQDVWVEKRFDLCRRCQREYLRNPLPPREGS